MRKPKILCPYCSDPLKKVTRSDTDGVQSYQRTYYVCKKDDYRYSFEDDD